uniref:Fibroblast growth factor n=1 Tax=Eptatretus burgeri TaxID=7764 RepID=A0A8C4NDT6_EPTBU
MTAIAVLTVGALCVVAASPHPGGPQLTGGSIRNNSFVVEQKLDREVRSSYRHLEGDIRRRMLFSATRFFLRISRSGKVGGIKRKKRRFTLMEIKSVDVGIVAIKGLNTGFFLAMNSHGKIYGTKEFDDSCYFRERIQENGYNTYRALRVGETGQQLYLALGFDGKPRRGSRARANHPSTHFLPMLPT